MFNGGVIIAGALSALFATGLMGCLRRNRLLAGVSTMLMAGSTSLVLVDIFT